MASPAQAIRSRLLNTFFSRNSIWFICISLTIYLSWIIFFQQAHFIYYFFSDTVLNVTWVITLFLSLDYSKVVSPQIVFSNDWVVLAIKLPLIHHDQPLMEWCNFQMDQQIKNSDPS